MRPSFALPAALPTATGVAAFLTPTGRADAASIGLPQLPPGAVAGFTLAALAFLRGRA